MNRKIQSRMVMINSLILFTTAYSLMVILNAPFTKIVSGFIFMLSGVLFAHSIELKQ